MTKCRETCSCGATHDGDSMSVSAFRRGHIHEMQATSQPEPTPTGEAIGYPIEAGETDLHLGFTTPGTYRTDDRSTS